VDNGVSAEATTSRSTSGIGGASADEQPRSWKRTIPSTIVISVKLVSTSWWTNASSASESEGVMSYQGPQRSKFAPRHTRTSATTSLEGSRMNNVPGNFG
jgi:hypothetical protein